MKQNKSLLLFPYLLVFALLGAVALSFPQKDLHLCLNAYHSLLLDKLMVVFSSIAAYGIYAALLFLLLWRWKIALALLVAHLSSTAVTQIIKHIAKAPRPAVVFDLTNNPDALPIVENVRMHLNNSFPSGHTTTASTLCVFLTLLVFTLMFQHSDGRSKGNKHLIFVLIYLLFFIVCLACAYSRIYLSQHFLLDVAVGGIIGTLTSAFVWHLSYLRW